MYGFGRIWCASLLNFLCTWCISLQTSAGHQFLLSIIPQALGGPWISLRLDLLRENQWKRVVKLPIKFLLKKNIFLSFRKNFITPFICELGPSSQRWRVGMLSGHLWKDQKFNEHWYIGGFRAHLPSPVICHVQRGSFA